MTETSPGGPRIIKRYANRKLYDTTAGALTSLSRVEELVRSGIDIRVIDHDTGADLTGESLSAILSSSTVRGDEEIDIVLLTALIRSPGDIVKILLRDGQRADELRLMRDRVRTLSSTIDSLLDGAAGQADGGAAPVEKPPRRPKGRG